MEWVETTGKTVDDARERALDQLGVAGDDAEFEVIEEPRSGLFGLTRGEARVRARVRPTEVRPKQERRRGRKSASADTNEQADAPGTSDDSGRGRKGGREGGRDGGRDGGRNGSRNGGRDGGRSDGRGRSNDRSSRSEPRDRTDDRPPVEPQLVGDAAVAFMSGLGSAFGVEAETTLSIEGTELEVEMHGSDLGLLIGPGGRTLVAVQDLVRVAAQRRLGDHDTRLRIDIASYRERRRVALEEFAGKVAEQVLASGEAKALEPMTSADRKVVHDAIGAIDGVESHSEGDDANRRIIIAPG